MYYITLHLFLIILIIIFLARQLEHGLCIPDFPQQPVVQVPVQHLQNEEGAGREEVPLRAKPVVGHRR